MARNRITNPRALQRLAEQTQRPIVGALTRGGTDHRIDAFESDGTVWCVYKDGSVERSDIRVSASINDPDRIG